MKRGQKTDKKRCSSALLDHNKDTNRDEGDEKTDEWKTGEMRKERRRSEAWEQLTAARDMLIGSIHAELQRR